MTIDMPSEANADIKSIGEILKNKREELSYTLEHVSEITRISLSTLQNIEEGKLENKSGMVFVRGFIRNYAKLLGLESDWMIDVLNREYGEAPSTAGNSTEKINTNLSNVNKYFIVGCLAIILVIGGLIYWNFHHTPQISPAVETIESIESAPQQDATTAPAETQPEAAVEAVTPPLVISPLKLVLLAKQSEWIHLKVDDKEPKEVLLQAGEKYEWPGDEQYELMMTTGQTAQIYLNGEEIEVPEDQKDRLFQIKLNKFSLVKNNN